jgi:uncharacterized protein YhaN
VKITALEIDGFGVWSGLKLERLSDGLNVFYGPNEAGKTTLLEFVRSTLYGFSPARRRYLPPVSGGRAGGSLYVAGPQGRVQISRYDQPANAGGEQVVLIAPDGTRHGAHLLQTLLANVDEKIFNNVFAVGLRDLQELGTLSDTEAAAMLYNLSIGLDRVSLVEVMRELDGSRNRILDSRGGASQVAQLLAQRDQIRAEVQETGALTRHYARLAAERDQLDREAGRLEEEVRELQQQTRVLQIAIAQYDRWQRREVLNEQLAALGPEEKIPEGTLERLGAVTDKLKRRQDGVAQLKRQRAQVRAEGKGLALNEAIWRLAPRVEAVKEQEGWIGTLEKQVADLEKEIGQLEGQLSAEQQRFGLSHGKGSGGLSTLSSRALMALRYPAKAVGRLRRQLEQAQQEAGKANETAQSLSVQIESSLKARGEKNLAPAMDRVGGLVGQLRRRVQLDERLEQMGRYQAELEEQNNHLLEHQLLPGPAVAGLGALFVVGVVLLMAGLFVPASILGALGWPLAFLGLIATGTSVSTKYLLERASARRLDQCQKQLHMLQSQIKQARQERDALDEQLPHGGGPIVNRLQAAEKELAALEELVPMDSRRQAAHQEAEAATQRARQAESGLTVAQRRWREALTKAGLPQNLTPKQARDLVVRCDDVVDTQRRLDRRYEEFQQRSHELEALKKRITQLATDCHVKLQSDEPIEQVRELVGELDGQDARRKRRDQLRAQMRQIHRKRMKHEEAIDRLKRRRRELLRESGVSDEATLRQRVAEIERTAELRRERQAVQREIDAAIAGCCAEQLLGEQIQGAAKQALEARREQLEKRYQAAEGQLQKRFEARGRLNEQLKTLVDDGSPGAKQLALGVVEKRLEEAVDRWRVLAATHHILQSVRKTYERERQPETLREASDYLEQLTEGRYPRVWTPLDENILLVDDAAGKSLPIDVLSQGTREQLFLSLRLALANCYAKRGTTLPIVLDDVLVNCDMQRARAAAGVLCNFAEAGHQVFVFTCHEHMVALFQGLHVDVAELGRNGLVRSRPSGPVEIAEERPAKKRTRRRIEVEPEPAAEPEPMVAEPEPEPAPVAEEPPQPPMRERRSRARKHRKAEKPPKQEEPPESDEPVESEEPAAMPPVEEEPTPTAPTTRVKEVARRDDEEERWRGGLAPWEEPWGDEPGEERDHLYAAEEEDDVDREPTDEEQPDFAAKDDIQPPDEEDRQSFAFDDEEDQPEEDLFAEEDEDQFDDSLFPSDEDEADEEELDATEDDDYGDDGFDDAEAA